MKTSEINNLIISALDPDADLSEVSKKLKEEGLDYDFQRGFRNKILIEIFSTQLALKLESEFVKYLNFAFQRIAFTGVAAIIVLLISIFLMEDSLSINSFFGLSDSYDESIVFLLTGN